MFLATIFIFMQNIAISNILIVIRVINIFMFNSYQSLDSLKTACYDIPSNGVFIEEKAAFISLLKIITFENVENVI